MNGNTRVSPEMVEGPAGTEAIAERNTTMAVDEKLAVIARALLILSAKAAHTWDYDGETMVGEGVSLDPDIEAALEQIASILTDRLWSEGGTRL